jgi:hypothetical protein
LGAIIGNIASLPVAARIYDPWHLARASEEVGRVEQSRAIPRGGQILSPVLIVSRIAADCRLADALRMMDQAAYSWTQY